MHEIRLLNVCCRNKFRFYGGGLIPLPAPPISCVLMFCLQYFGPDAQLEVNLDEKSKAALALTVASGEITHTLFEPMIARAEKEMAGDILPRFIKSPAWRTLCDPSRQLTPVLSPVRSSMPAPSSPLVTAIAAPSISSSPSAGEAM